MMEDSISLSTFENVLWKNDRPDWVKMIGSEYNSLKSQIMSKYQLTQHIHTHTYICVCVNVLSQLIFWRP